MSKAEIKNAIQVIATEDVPGNNTKERVSEVLDDIVDIIPEVTGEEGNDSTKAISQEAWTRENSKKANNIDDNGNPLLYDDRNLFEASKVTKGLTITSAGSILANSSSSYYILNVIGVKRVDILRSSLANNRMRYVFTSDIPAVGVSVLGGIYDSSLDNSLKFSIDIPVSANYILFYLDNTSNALDYSNIKMSVSLSSGFDAIFRDTRIALSSQNLFNSYKIYNLGLNADFTQIMASPVGRMTYIEVKKGERFLVRRDEISSNRFIVGYTKDLPTANVVVYDAVNNNSKASFETEATHDGYLILYLSNASESNFATYQIYKLNNVESKHLSANELLSKYIPNFNDNIFSPDMLRDVGFSATGNIQYYSSGAYKSLLIIGQPGDRYLLQMNGIDAPRTRIAYSTTTDEAEVGHTIKKPFAIENKDGEKSVLIEFDDKTYQVYVWLSNNYAEGQLDDLILSKLPSADTNKKDTQFVTGKLDYFEAPITEDVSPNSTTFNLRDSLITDIYDRYDALMAQYPDRITKTLLGYGSSDTTLNATEYPIDESLPIYEYRIKPLQDYTGSNSLNPNGYKVKDAPLIMINTSIHGDEKSPSWATYLMVKQMLETSDRNSVLYTIQSQCELSIVPCPNPYGFNYHQRVLACNIDPNRIFAYNSNAYPYPEGNALRAWIDNNSERASIFIDFHCLEGYRPLSFYMTSYNQNSFDLFGAFAREITPRMKEIYEKSIDNTLDGFFTYTEGALLESYANLWGRIPLTAVLETYEDFGGVLYSQKVIQASLEILVNYIRVNLMYLNRLK